MLPSSYLDLFLKIFIRIKNLSRGIHPQVLRGGCTLWSSEEHSTILFSWRTWIFLLKVKGSTVLSLDHSGHPPSQDLGVDAPT